MDKQIQRSEKLNETQLKVLELLYKFRFGSSDLFAQHFGEKDRSFVYACLLTLQEQGSIAKRYNSSYKLQGKPAAYYLTSRGARIVRAHRNLDSDPINLKVIYKNKTVSEAFIARCISLFAIHNSLTIQYGHALKFFAKIDLNVDSYGYFPKPLPDAFVALRTEQKSKRFFLELFNDKTPTFLRNRIKQYVDYFDSKAWDETGREFPTILFVCSSSAIEKRTRKYLEEFEDATVNIKLATTTQEGLKSATKDTETIWRVSSEADEPLSLWVM